MQVERRRRSPADARSARKGDAPLSCWSGIKGWPLSHGMTNDLAGTCCRDGCTKKCSGDVLSYNVTLKDSVMLTHN